MEGKWRKQVEKEGFLLIGSPVAQDDVELDALVCNPGRGKAVATAVWPSGHKQLIALWQFQKQECQDFFEKQPKQGGGGRFRFNHAPKTPSRKPAMFMCVRVRVCVCVCVTPKSFKSFTNCEVQLLTPTAMRRRRRRCGPPVGRPRGTSPWCPPALRGLVSDREGGFTPTRPAKHHGGGSPLRLLPLSPGPHYVHAPPPYT